MKGKKKSKGIITVFVTLMLVPMIVCTGTMVDAARLKLYSSQAAMVADTYGEVVLSEYDNLLKDLYGLFSITQSEEGKKAIEDLAAYTTYSFIPNGDKEEGKGFSGYMPYKDAKVEVSYKPIEGAKLSDRDVLSTQIGDFMKFRAIAEMLEGDNAGMLEKLSGFENAKKDMELAEQRSQLTDDCMEAFAKIGEYYNVLKCLNDYPSYVGKAEDAMKRYTNELKGIYNADVTTSRYKYAGYVHKQYRDYIANKANIDAAKKRVEDVEAEAEEIKAANQKERNKAAKDPEYEAVIKEVPKPDEADVALKEMWVDEDRFKTALNTRLNNLYPTVTKNLIAFGEVEGKITELDALATEISGKLTALKAKAESIEAELLTYNGSNENMKESMKKEVEKIKEVTEAAEDFAGVVTYLKDVIKASEQDKTNKTNWDTKVSEMEKVEEELLTGKSLNTSTWGTPVSMGKRSFREKYDAFYLMLEEMCGGKKNPNNAEGADADAGNKKVDKANEDAAKATDDQEKADKEELDKKNIRNVGDKLKGQLIGHTKETENSDDEMKGFGSLITGDAGFGTLANTMINKLLLVTYDFGMFSSRVTSVEPPAKEGETPGAGDTPTGTPTPAPTAGAEKEDDEYKEYSLTKVEKSKDVNYLYEAELEYLIAGKTDSKKNLNTVRNIINTVRMSMNFVATYSISEINTAIETISNSAQAAVAATVVGAPLAPAVYVAVNGALRLLVATLESVADWDLLKQRKDVLFYKKELGDLNTAGIGDYLEGKVGDTKNAKKSVGELTFSYEDYLYLMMLVFVNDDKLLDRTANLITLNVNQSQNSTENDLETLSFKMTDTVTAVKSTCQVDLKCLIVPENMSNMFLNYNGASDEKYKQTIQKLDDGTYAYSIIRGY